MQHKIYYFDAETETIAKLKTQEYTHPRFVLGCVLTEKDANGVRREIALHSIQDLLEFINSTGPQDTVIAHNAGNFDALLILDECQHRLTKVKGIISGGSLISVSLELDGIRRCRIVDSIRILQSSLDKITGGKKLKFPLTCICEKDCGGYCAATPTITGKARKDLYAYCRNDVQILADVYEKCLSSIEANGYTVRTAKGVPLITAGSICVRNMFNSIGEPLDSPVSALEYELATRGYYGGRCQVFRAFMSEGFASDEKSMYPYNATLPLPWGRGKVVTNPREARKEFEADRLGIYYIRAVVPQGVIPPLPEKFKGRVVWHTGAIHGAYTHIELKAALPYLSALAFESALIYYEERTFSEFYNRVYKLKEKAELEGDEFMRFVWKIFLNTGYGKLASGPEHESLILTDDRYDDQNLQYNGYTIEHTRDNRPSVWARPGAAAYITAYGRARMLGYLNSPDIVPAYCDTDGIVYSGNAPLPSRTGLGGLALESIVHNFIAQAPKAYTYERFTPDGPREYKGTVVKLKGVNLRGMNDAAKIDAFVKYALGGELSSDSLTKVKSGARVGRLLSRSTVTRSRAASPLLAGNDLITDDYKTVPLHRDDVGWSYPGHNINPLECLPWLRPDRAANRPAF